MIGERFFFVCVWRGAPFRERRKNHFSTSRFIFDAPLPFCLFFAKKYGKTEGAGKKERKPFSLFGSTTLSFAFLTSRLSGSERRKGERKEAEVSRKKKGKKKGEATDEAKLF